IDGAAILPAVLALEAMAQAASALAGGDAPTGIDDVSFRQAIIVPDRSAAHVKILALVSEPGRVDVVIRSDDDGFVADRMRATFRFGPAAPLHHAPHANGHAAAAIEARRLYGPLLFQGEAFRGLHTYTRLSARRVAATLLPATPRAWFA